MRMSNRSFVEKGKIFFERLKDGRKYDRTKWTVYRLAKFLFRMKKFAFSLVQKKKRRKEKKSQLLFAPI